MSFDGCEELKKFNQDYQAEIEGHKIKKHYSDKKHEHDREYLEIGENLDKAIKSCTDKDFEEKDCKAIKIAMKSWEEEARKYVKIGFLLKKYLKRLQNLQNILDKKGCKK